MLTELFKKQAPKHPINPRFRAYGKARLDIARRAATRSEWERLWKEPAFPFPFTWGEWWKQCIEYKVDDFAAEVGFYTDILGLPVIAFDPNYAMFTSPAEEFYLAIIPAFEPGKSTPAEALRIQFMVANIFETVRELERRGIVFEQKPQPCERGSSMFLTYFRTPHGICVDLWGLVPLGDQPSSDLETDIGTKDATPVEQAENSEYTDETHDREDKRSFTGEFFEEEEENIETGSDSDLRFFVGPARDFESTIEVEETTNSSGLNFGFVELGKDAGDDPQPATGFEDKDSFQDEGKFDEEEDDAWDDDAYPLEYVYEDDL